jgi:hypothetical protein
MRYALCDLLWFIFALAMASSALEKAAKNPDMRRRCL